MRLLTLVCALHISSAWRTDPRWLKEAEKKHSRVALLALPTLFALKHAGVEDPPSFLASQPIATQIDFFSAAGLLEAGVSLPRLRNWFELRPDFEPGNITGDVIKTDLAKALDKAETGLGRLAMICSATWLLLSVAY